MSPRKILFVVGAALLCSTMALAQASGNFTYDNSGANISCTLESNGQIKGGGHMCSAGTDCTASGCTPIPAGANDCGGSLGAGIKTNSGAGNVFVIRPSAVIGLLTDVTINTKNQSSSALAGVDLNVIVAPQGDDTCGTKSPDAACPSLAPGQGAWITYDSRYIQISSNLFNALTASCVGTTTAGDGCFFTFNESTVSAHSFDWIAGAPTSGGGGTLSSGNYNITVNWKSSVNATQGLSEALTCVGPLNLTVQQNKVFSFNSPTNTL